VLPAHAGGDVGGEVHGQGRRAQRRSRLGRHGRDAGGRRGRRRGGSSREILLDRQAGLRGLPVGTPRRRTQWVVVPLKPPSGGFLLLRRVLRHSQNGRAFPPTMAAIRKKKSSGCRASSS